MGMYDDYDKDMIQKAGLIWVIFFLALAFAFIILKLVSVITWSWWWVFAPLWIPMFLGTIMNVLGIKPPGQE